MTALRDEMVKLIHMLQAIGRNGRTPALERLLTNLLSAVDQYDTDKANDEPPKMGNTLHKRTFDGRS